ncbi:MAG: hypothetical protein OEY20_14205 [Gemmatimonadota bacterium]|nr:hypothetical protein [Gemmatimonadota bacterium]
MEHQHVAQEFRGQPIVTDATIRVIVTVVVDSAASGFVVEAVVDSAAVVGDAGFSPEVVPAAIGARFLARLSAGGSVMELTPPASSSPLLEQLALDMYDVVPRLPSDGALPGAGWNETTTVGGRSAGIPITLERRATNGADSWIVGAGERTLPVTTVTDYSLTGEGERSGQWLTITGTGRSHHYRLLTAAGVVAHGIRSDTLRVEIELPGSGLLIPLTQIRTDTVRRVIR